jgi:L,D-transpeptidase catalytic domain
MRVNRSHFNIRVSVSRLMLTILMLGLVSPAVSEAPAAASAEFAPIAAEAPRTSGEVGLPVEAEVQAPPASSSPFDATSWKQQNDGLSPEVLALALRAAAAAVERNEAVAPATLTVIDFSRPSTAERMWVYDLRTRELLFKELVSHGRGSGRTDATAFSNQPESNKSSLGLYRTAETYFGKHGYSLRLDGLEPGVNDRARDRGIVMHAADYVNGGAAKAQGYLGRSLGCPAVRPEITRELIETVKDGGLVFAYYPDPAWLAASTYLN